MRAYADAASKWRQEKFDAANTSGSDTVNSSARLTLATADEELMDKWMDGLKQLLAGLVVRAMALGHSNRDAKLH